MDFIRKLFQCYKNDSIIPHVVPGGYSYSAWTDSRGGQWFIVLAPGGTVLAQSYNAEFAAKITDALNRA